MCFSKRKFSKKFPKNYSGALGEYWGALGGTREAGTWGYSGALREYLGIPGHSGSSGEYSGVLVFQKKFQKITTFICFVKLFLSKKLFFEGTTFLIKISLHIFSKKFVLKNYFSEKLLRQICFSKISFFRQISKKYRKKSDFKQNLTIFFQKKGFQTTFFSKNFQ